jgi:hypothetical protein
MNKKLPNLPMELINKILIMRPTHPVAKIIKKYSYHHEKGDWYYDKKMTPDFQEWFFSERNRNSFNRFEVFKGEIHLFKNKYYISDGCNRCFYWSKERHEDYIKNRICVGYTFGMDSTKIFDYIDKIHNLNLDNGTKRISK